MGITLVTVSHRPNLWKYHDWLMKIEDDDSSKDESGRDSFGHCKVIFESMDNYIKEIEQFKKTHDHHENMQMSAKSQGQADEEEEEHVATPAVPEKNA